MNAFHLYDVRYGLSFDLILDYASHSELAKVEYKENQMICLFIGSCHNIAGRFQCFF
jgi:hypothetical protein